MRLNPVPFWTAPLPPLSVVRYSGGFFTNGDSHKIPPSAGHVTRAIELACDFERPRFQRKPADHRPT